MPVHGIVVPRLELTFGSEGNQPANSLPLIEKLGALENFLFFSIHIDLDETGKADLSQKRAQAHDGFGHRGD